VGRGDWFWLVSWDVVVVSGDIFSPVKTPRIVRKWVGTPHQTATVKAVVD